MVHSHADPIWPDGTFNTGGALTLEYLRNFRKKLEITLQLFSRAWGKMIHEKNLKQKTRDTVSLTFNS
jgi:hypothetical protein